MTSEVLANRCGILADVTEVYLRERGESIRTLPQVSTR
jgi:hypothetical protein